MRLAKYRRVLRLENTVAAGLLGGVTLFAAVRFTTTPTRLSLVAGGIFLTLIFAAGFLLAFSRERIEWQADLLDRYLPTVSTSGSGPAPSTANPLTFSDLMQDAPNKTHDPQILAEWPVTERAYRRAALVLIRIAGAVLLFNVWLPLFGLEARKPSVEEKHLNVQIEILFAVNSAVPDPGSVGLLAALARSAIVSQVSQDRFVVEGHTDSAGSSEYNLALARARAEAVRALLIAGGIGSTRIRVVAFGKTQPRNQNRTVEEQSMNRRVIIRSIHS